MPRLFIAIPLPEPILQALEGFEEPHPGVSWVPSENRHLTLQFIGARPQADIRRITDAVGLIDLAPFILPVEGVGKFPPKGPPRVLWAGVGNGHPRLFALRKRIADALMPLGIEPDAQAYVPHMTLARCKPAAAEFTRQFLKKHAQFQGPPFRVREFVLYESEPGGGAPVYTPLASRELR